MAQREPGRQFLKAAADVPSRPALYAHAEMRTLPVDAYMPYRRLGARGRRVKYCRERMQIMRFCVRAALSGLWAFSVAPGGRAA